MKNFHAVLLDETGCEFGADVRASSHEDAREKLREDYPESSVVQLESPEDAAARQAAIYARVSDDDYDYADDY